jgi:hypothetical protein
MFCRSLIVSVSLCALVACTNPFKAGEMSDAGVAAFHRQLNQAQFHQMYASASPDFQQATSEKDITELFNAIHTKLGDVTGTNRTNIFLNATTSGNFARVTYHTTFAHGTGEETFNWRISNGQLSLVGYHIESRDLIVK